MAYVPQNFYSGQKLTDEHLKHIEAGIQTADANAERALKTVQDAIATIPEAVETAVNEWLDEHPNVGKTALDTFLDNVDVDYAYDETTGAYYTVIRVYKQKLDGSYQYPFVYAPNGSGSGDKSTYDMTVSSDWLLAINSGIFDMSNRKPDGIVIQNGVVVQNSPSATSSMCKPLTIDKNGNLSYVGYNANANDLVSSGIVSAVCGFMPIIVDYKAVPSTEWNSVAHYTENAQRQIIGQWGNGDYAIITCEGRNFHNSDGWTIEEAQAVCMKHGLKFAYNLDGGGSTETMLGHKHINTIYENTTGRIVPTFIVFNGKSVFSDVPDEPDVPDVPTKNLVSISATYSGGNVAVGTNVNSLTGVVVTATYDDGSTETVTDYTLNGSIIEGSNTIVVLYEGKTTTFTVTGVAVANVTFLIGYSNLVSYYGEPGKEVLTWNLVENNDRIAVITTEPNVENQVGCPVNGVTYYPIPVPSDATKATLTCPGFIGACRFLSYDRDTGVYISMLDPGWTTVGGFTQEFEAGAYEYVIFNTKKENGGSSAGTDTSKFSVVFE